MSKRRGRTQKGRGAPVEVHGRRLRPACELEDEYSEDAMSTEETTDKAVDEQAQEGDEGEGEDMEGDP